MGRRVTEFYSLLSGLKLCQSYLVGPNPLTYDSVVGELKKAKEGTCTLCALIQIAGT